MKKLISSLLLIAMLMSAVSLALPAYAAKAELEVKWNTGYAVISIHNPYDLVEGYVASTNYSTTDVITIPKKGTRITWTDPSGFAPCSVLTLSSWKQEGGEWVLDADAPLFVGAKGAATTIIESPNANGLTYTYVTHSDNENIRLCVNGRNENIKVYAEEGTFASSWSRALTLYYDEPAAPVSKLTGAPVNATALEDVEWYYGYVGSASHSSSANKISKGSDVYLYSEVITVPRAGTTVYFYDDDCSDGQASSNAAVFSHWKKSGSSWAIDTKKPSIDGSAADRIQVGKYYLYSYTTTEDNENLRLCYRSALNDKSLSSRPYTVYLAAKTVIEPLKATDKLTSASFTDPFGSEQSYKVYIPEGYAENPSFPAVISIGSSTEIAEALIKDIKNVAVIAFDGTAASACDLIDAAVPAYGLHKDFLYLIGSAEIKDACGDLFANHITDGSKYSSPLEAGKALLSVAPAYAKQLEGLTMLAMGDSYFAGDGIGKDNTWVNILGNKYGMNFINYGIGGSTISAYVTTNNPMVNRIKQMEKLDADIILLEGGRNDYNKLVPLGDTDDKSPTTFYGALNSSLDYLRKTYPDALIILVTPWKLNSQNSIGYSNVTYAKAMRTVAEERKDPHIVCLYAADPDLTGVDMTNATFKMKYCIKPTDVSHLNIEGMKLVFPNMEKFVAEAYAEFIGYEEPQTTVEETTAAPEPETEATSAPETTAAPETEPEKTGGCGAFASFGALMAVVCGAWLIIKKNK